MFALTGFTAAAAGYRTATLTWSSTGGCQPIKGTINGECGASYSSSWQVSISGQSGSVTDTHITSCGYANPCTGSAMAGITYLIVLNDAAGYRVDNFNSPRFVTVGVC